ncbi:MAG: hypothetical protein ACRCZJ_09140 [Erysipelotrichaceae bacterium]
MKRKILSLFISMAMFFALLPTSALAITQNGDGSYTLPDDAYYLGTDDTSTNDHTVARFVWIEGDHIYIALDINMDSGGKGIKYSLIEVAGIEGKLRSDAIIGTDNGFDILRFPNGDVVAPISSGFNWQIASYQLPDGYKIATNQVISISTEQQGNESEVTAQGHEIKNVRFTIQGPVSSVVSYAYVGTVPEGATTPPADKIYDEKINVAVEAEPSVPGWAFSGWSTSDVEVVDGNFTMPKNNVHFVGSWTYILGDVSVSATVDDATYQEITPINLFTIQDIDYYNKVTNVYYERSVSVDFIRDKTEIYNRTVTEYYQKYAQRFLVPTFERAIEEWYGTLVTRLNYSDNTTKSTPTNGGTFNNGHTYVAVSVAEASSEEGIWFTIADSSKTNGKKAPSEYNRPIEYQYNVKIVDGILTITFPKDLAYANVGAYIYSSIPKKFGNAPKHYANTVSVALPSDAKDTVYLYTHIDGLARYIFDENGKPVYTFKEWRFDATRQEVDEDYTLVDTLYGPEILGEADYGPYIEQNPVYGEYVKVNEEPGDDNFAYTETGAKVANGTSSKTETKTAAFTGTLTLTINGEVMPLDTTLSLAPGFYTFRVTGEGITPQEKVVEIVAGSNTPITFNNLVYSKADVTLDAIDDITHLDNAKDYLEEVLEVEFKKDLETEKFYKDNLIGTKTIDLDATRVYLDDYKFYPDIYLGTDDDPWGVYAVRIN